MNDKSLQSAIEELNAFQSKIFKRFDSIDQRLNTIEANIREIKSDISRIDANIEIMATSQGYPYSKQERIVSAFERKFS